MILENQCGPNEEGGKEESDMERGGSDSKDTPCWQWHLSLLGTSSGKLKYLLGDAKCCSQLTAIAKEPGHPPAMTCHVQYQGLGEPVELFSGPTLWVQ